jgi:toxin YoeB
MTLTYKILWTPEAQKDLSYWTITDKTKLNRIKDLIKDIKLNPTKGIAKPERLKYKDKNIWSRRMDKKHRLVYLIDKDQCVYIIQARFHYE